MSDLRAPRLSNTGDDFFVLSHRLHSDDGSFRGIISVALRPNYFENFYALVGQTPGSFYSLVRGDGTILARFPYDKTRTRQLSGKSGLQLAIGKGEERGLFTVKSEIDNIPRRMGFRRLEGFPVYALAGTEATEIRGRMAFGGGLVSDVRAACGAAVVRRVVDRAQAHRAAARRGRAA